MAGTDEAATLAILTFWVGPFLLGVEADQIVRLPPPPRQMSSTPGIGSVEHLPMLDLRTACGLSPAPSEDHQQILVIDRGGERTGYKVDKVGDLISVDLARQVWKLPPLLEVHKQWKQLWGVCQWRDELVLLVDLQYEA
jgi:chemotaxis signal transduction protein